VFVSVSRSSRVLPIAVLRTMRRASVQPWTCASLRHDVAKRATTLDGATEGKAKSIQEVRRQ